MSTLENQLETAYAKLVKANEPDLAEVPFRLSALILAQPPLPENEQGEEVEQMPEEYVLLRANRGEESPENSGIFPVDLVIEAGANAQGASANGGRLDAIFQAAARPLFYKTLTDETQDPPVVMTLFQALSMATQNFLCYGLLRRANGSEMVYEGSVVKRIITATFHCTTTA